MRRLTMEMSLDELNKFEEDELTSKVKSLEILQFLREDSEELSMVCRIQFNDPSDRLEDYAPADLIDMQLLDRGDDGAGTYFIRTRPSMQPSSSFDPFSSGGYLSLPFEIKDGRVRITYLGSAKQVRAFMDSVEAAGVHYRVASMSDAKFSRDSPLNSLTEKQRRVLVAAFRLGYYDEPRRISSADLAKKLKVGSSTLINHRRRAERRLLKELIGTGPV